MATKHNVLQITVSPSGEGSCTVTNMICMWIDY